MFRRNLAAYIGGDPKYARGFNGQNHVNANCPGCDGSGFWFRGVMNTFDRNEAWNNFRGINLFNQQQVAGRYPSAPGAMPDTANNNHLMQPIAMTGNVVAANVLAGYEYWAVRRFPNENLISAYNKSFQVMGVQSDGIDHWYRNPHLICQVGSARLGRGAQFDGVHRQFRDRWRGPDRGLWHRHHWGRRQARSEPHWNRLAERSQYRHAAPVGTIRERAACAAGEPSALNTFCSTRDSHAGSRVWNGTDPLPKVGISTWVPSADPGW